MLRDTNDISTHQYQNVEHNKKKRVRFHTQKYFHSTLPIPYKIRHHNIVLLNDQRIKKDEQCVRESTL